jgi:lipopolysaccharide export system ATP-binding protein
MAISEVTSAIRRLANDGVGVLLSDHDVRQTLEVCDRIYILFEGTLLCRGTPEEVSKDPAARARYFGDALASTHEVFGVDETPQQTVELKMGV